MDNYLTILAIIGIAVVIYLIVQEDKMDNETTDIDNPYHRGVDGVDDNTDEWSAYNDG